MKNVFHFALVIFTSYVLIEQSNRTNSYSIATTNNLCHEFYPDECLGTFGGCRDMTTYDDDRYCRLSRKNGTVGIVRKIVDRFEDFWKESVAGYQRLNGTGVTMDVVSHDNVDSEKNHYSKYALNASYLGPLDTNYNTNLDIRAFYASLSSFTLSFPIHDEIPLSSNNDESSAACWKWNVEIFFKDEDSSHLKMIVMGTITGLCGDADMEEERFSLNWCFHVTIIILAIVTSSITLFHIFRSFRRILICRRLLRTDKTLFNRMPPFLQLKLKLITKGETETRTEEEEEKEEEEGGKNIPPPPPVPTRVLLMLIDGWDIILLLTCSLMIFACLGRILGNSIMSLHQDQATFGFGCCCLWFTTVKYMQNSSRLYAIVLIVKRAAPQVFEILIGAIPGFVCYGILGTAIFGLTSTRFGSLQNSLTTLFAIMNGDLILETLDVVRLNFPVFGPIYITSFFFLYVYFFLNVILTVVEESLWLLSAEAEQLKDPDLGGYSSRFTRSFSTVMLSRKLSRHSQNLRSRRRSSLRHSSGSLSLSRGSSILAIFKRLDGGGGDDLKDKQAVSLGVDSVNYFLGLMQIVDAYEKFTGGIETTTTPRRNVKWVICSFAVILVSYLLSLAIGYFCLISEEAGD